MTRAYSSRFQIIASAALLVGMLAIIFVVAGR